MDLEIKILNPLNNSQWNEKILDFTNYNFFHSREWCEVLTETYNFTPYYVSIIQENNFEIIFPFLISKTPYRKTQLISLPFTDYVDPLLNRKNEELEFLDLIPLISHFKNLNYSFFELRSSLLNNDLNTEISPDYLHKINLIDIQKLFKQFSHSTKCNIKKATKMDVRVGINNDSSHLNIFYNLQVLTRKRHGLPPQPIKFFDKIYEKIISRSKGDIFFAFFGKIPISAGLFFKFGNKVIFKYANSDYRYQHLRANNLLIWEAIQYYESQGFKEFHFGKTEAGNEGLRKFKLGFNPDESTFYRTRYYNKNDKLIFLNSKQTKFIYYLFRFAPVNHLIKVGKILYPYIN